MSSTDHPFVAEYLARFEAESSGIREPRRSVLREEIAAHLRDAIPVSASDAEAAAVIASFGSPAEIIGQELDEPRPEPRGRSRRIVMVVGTAVIALALLAVPLWLWRPGMPPQRLPETSLPTPSPTAGASVVTEMPEGPERITTGTGYYEYLAAIEAMEYPLPEGAAYPLGVPVGLNEGENPSGILETGAGAVVANFTWLCAWEAEYLDAVDSGDDRRQVEAESMITAWSTSDFFRTISGGDGWVKSVVNPMKFGKSSGVKSDFPSTCAQASIFNVANG